jgi:hypothetical protein
MLGRFTGRLSAVLGCVAVIVALSGCAGSDVATQKNSDAFGALAVLYGQYRGAHSGQTPTSQADFEKFVKTHGGPTLEHFGITDVEQLFVSPRNEQAIDVVYGRGLSGDSDPIVAYERESVGGKRLVVRSHGSLEELDEAAFQQQHSGS